MKRIYFLLLGIFFFSCTSLVYKNESNIDYDVYRTAYIDIFQGVSDYLVDSDILMLNSFFMDKLAVKSEFKSIYSYYNDQQSKKSDSDCIINIYLLKMEREENFDSDNNRIVTITIKLRVEVVDNNGSLIFFSDVKSTKERTIDKYASVDEINSSIYLLSIDVFKDCIDKISSLFLRDLEI